MKKSQNPKFQGVAFLTRTWRLKKIWDLPFCEYYIIVDFFHKVFEPFPIYFYRKALFDSKEEKKELHENILKKNSLTENKEYNNTQTVYFLREEPPAPIAQIKSRISDKTSAAHEFENLTKKKLHAQIQICLVLMNKQF